MKRTATAHWSGNLKDGKGNLSTPSTILNQTQYSFKTRFEEGAGTNPEELLAAAHAGCFTMAISAALTQSGAVADSLDTAVTVDVDMATLKITNIHLAVTGKVPGISKEKFEEVAQGAKVNCIISKAISAPITLDVTFI
ncbi:MAG: OsmC family protein [Cytophagales bacterium]|nr:OsmC family protein [Cytophagales bacterium]